MANTLRPVQPSLRCLLRRSAAALVGKAWRARGHALQGPPGGISGRSRRFAASRCIAQSDDRSTASLDVQRVINRARKAAAQDFAPNSVIDVNGHGHHMGMDVVWQLKLRPDGAYLETISSKELTFRSGCNGGADSHSWEIDDTGVPKRLQLDDNEACLVAAWVKSGLWLSPDVVDILDISLVVNQADEFEATALPAALVAAADTSTNLTSEPQRPKDSLHQPVGGPSTSDSPSTSNSPSISSSANNSSNMKASNAASLSADSKHELHSKQSEHAADARLNDHHQNPGSNSARSSSSSSSSSSNSEASSHIDWDQDTDSVASTNTEAVRKHEASSQDSKPYVMLAVKLKSGRLVSQVRVCSESWLPIALLQPECGEVHTWHYQQWQEWEPDFFFPTEHIHLTPSGGNNHITTTSASTSLAPKLPTFVMPEPLLTPQDTSFDPELLATVQAWHTRSGHVLVQPKINGQDVGYMMLDTGASGLVIEEKTANDLGLASFGEVHVAGMGGRLLCKFRRGQELSLGPVTIQRPLFMQMSLAGVVNGAPGPVTGILGYDLFRRCVMELPPSSHDKANAPFTLSLHDPSTKTPDPSLTHRWQPITLVANLPHVEVMLTVDQGHEPVPCLFMLDSGAGGVDAMFHARAVKELGLASSSKHGMRTLTGVGGAAVAGMQVKSGELRSIELSNQKFHNIKCLFTDSDGLDHTLYSCGILCGDIMSRCSVILDYARDCIMFLPKPDSA